MSFKDYIREFIEKEILNSQENVSGDIHLIESGMIDSISLMKLLTYIEGEFAIQFDDDDFDIENFSTINKINAIVEKNKNKNKSTYFK